MGRMLSSWKSRWQETDPSLKAFLLGILFLGINNGLLNSTFNNYLNDRFHLTASGRGGLEFPREFPGFAIIFVTGLLSAFAMRTWAVLVGIFAAIGVGGLGLLSPTVSVMMIWMCLWSLSDHLFMPVEGAVGLAMAKEGRQGRRLGQISGYRYLASILGCGVVWLLAQGKPKHYYAWLYAFGAVVALLAAWAFSRVKVPGDQAGAHKRFVWRGKYRYFYWLNVLFGARKQLFLTFGPWVLVTVFGTQAGTMAILTMIAAVLGVVFRQAFGMGVDCFGERTMLLADAVILLGICLGYAFAPWRYLLYALYILDNLMFSTRIARTTYLNRIAVEKSDIPATLSLGVSLDHICSMTLPVFGGLLWKAYGYPAVFLAASFLALLGFIVAWRMERAAGETVAA